MRVPSLRAGDERVRFLRQSTEDPLAHDGPNVIHNLGRSPKKISSMYVYDERGTRLYEQQCRTPEYYLWRVEAQLLRAHAREIVELCERVPIVEFGAGTCEKTRFLLAEYARRRGRTDFYPIDLNVETLLLAAHRLASDYPHLWIHCVGATYHDALRILPQSPRGRLILFLGSALGNLETAEIDDLLASLFRHSVSGDYVLLGADLDKDPTLIERAYNDAAGYGAQSTLNMLCHVNRRYGGDFALEQFRYRSAYDAAAKRNEVHIESLVPQRVTLAGLGVTIAFGRLEPIEAEIMWKFDPEDLGAMWDRAGFSMARRWIDPIYRYGLFLLRRR